MASIHRDILVACSPGHAWDAIRDVGAIHVRLVPGFVTDCVLEGNVRTVTFANGIVAREVIVDLDEAARRLVWSAAGGRLTHHNASLEVVDEGEGGSRLVWIADLLPDAMKGPIDAMIEQGMAAMKRALESRA